TRQALERETVTAPSLDAAVARVEAHLDRLVDAPPDDDAPPVLPDAPHVWRLGELARSRTGGWEGRITALEKGDTRATLEAGDMRVSVATEDLDPVFEPAPPPDPDRTIGNIARIGRPGTRDRDNGIGAIQLQRARSVASSLDIRGARVEEALEALDRYLDDAGLAGLDKVVVIHGLGTGALRDAVRTRAAGHPLVASTRPGERGEGGDGATIVKL
ncbi:MAG: Smr/MutS family protein, partial [Chloroflexota bacterium]|nr:Smr/MutS family protein [Chloroflexota bacterium]